MSRLLAGLALLAATGPGTPGPLLVKASPAVAPCVTAAALEYRRVTGREVRVEAAVLVLRADASDADVVVAADEELVRILETGAHLPDQDVDVAEVPWVLAAPPGARVPDVRALSGSGLVRTLGGVAGREAWRVLGRQGVAPAHVDRMREPAGPVVLQAGETAIVPLSLAGPGPVSRLDVPPLVVRALGLRRSPRPEDTRAFLAYLTGAPGNAAFRACGRDTAR
jgi:hypothetical protein